MRELYPRLRFHISRRCIAVLHVRPLVSTEPADNIQLAFPDKKPRVNEKLTPSSGCTQSLKGFPITALSLVTRYTPHYKRRPYPNTMIVSALKPRRLWTNAIRGDMSSVARANYENRSSGSLVIRLLDSHVISQEPMQAHRVSSHVNLSKSSCRPSAQSANLAGGCKRAGACPVCKLLDRCCKRAAQAVDLHSYSIQAWFTLCMIAYCTWSNKSARTWSSQLIPFTFTVCCLAGREQNRLRLVAKAENRAINNLCSSFFSKLGTEGGQFQEPWVIDSQLGGSPNSWVVRSDQKWYYTVNPKILQNYHWNLKLYITHLTTRAKKLLRQSLQT